LATLVAADRAPVERLQRTWETPRGWRGVLSNVDHKTIGKRYLVTAFVFLIIGGLEALAMRAQLARASLSLLGPEQYNELFSMHGVTMIFLYAAPVLSGFSNFLWPLMLGARDMAFPRLNALSYWTFLAAGIFVYTSTLLGEMPNAGWFDYVPYAGAAYNPGRNIDFYALGLLLLSVSTTVGAVNFIVTLFTTRAPGMSLNRLPIIVWGTLSTSFVNLAAVPALSAALIFLYLDRRFGFHFYDAANEGHPLLWQHLFWMFGHPWVYVIVLPAIGIVSDALPTFARRPLVGYTFVALSTVVTALLGFGVWVHHMFATGLPPLSLSFFGAASMIIAIPSGVSTFAWVATVYYGRPRLTAAMLYMLGFIVLFVIGGVNGVMTAAVPFDWQLTDTYFVVAHLHYVLVGINVFPALAGVIYWFPKFTGRLMDERLAKWSFWTLFVATNVVFFPMHIVGMLGMPRRVYTYMPGLGWDAANLVETVGAGLFAVGMLVFLYDVVVSISRGQRAGPNPWDAGTLEWATSSPPPPYNFAVIPTVASRHPLWEDRLGGEGTGKSLVDRGPVLADGRATFETSALDGQPTAVIRMPEDSYAPVALAASLLALSYGLLFGAWWLAAAGAGATLVAVVAWLWPSSDELHNTGEVDTPFGELPTSGLGSNSVGFWGMCCVIGTEAALFGYFLFSYFYLGSMSTNPWPLYGAPDLKLVGLNTAILIGSSGVLIWAERGARAGDEARLRSGVAITIVMGVVFLALQMVEYHQKTFGPTSDASGSLFYTITGFHGAHVAVGLIMLLVVLVRATRGHFTARRHLAVTNAAMYWHFVDVVWLAVFTSLYLTPHFR